MKQSMQQVTQGQRITPEIQKDIDRRQTEMMGMIKEVLDWNKLEPVYVRVYQKTFTQGEVDGLTAFYKTPTGPGSLDEDAGSDAEHAERNATDDTADDATGSAHAAGGRSRDPGSKEEERRLEASNQIIAILRLNRETFSARAVRDGVRVGDFKTAFLQVVAVI